jgi:hypothetical protein
MRVVVDTVLRLWAPLPCRGSKSTMRAYRDWQSTIHSVTRHTSHTPPASLPSATVYASYGTTWWSASKVPVVKGHYVPPEVKNKILPVAVVCLNGKEALTGAFSTWQVSAQALCLNRKCLGFCSWPGLEGSMGYFVWLSAWSFPFPCLPCSVRAADEIALPRIRKASGRMKAIGKA